VRECEFNRAILYCAKSKSTRCDVKESVERRNKIKENEKKDIKTEKKEEE
jgi:hypothetical protein